MRKHIWIAIAVSLSVAACSAFSQTADNSQSVFDMRGQF